MMKSKPKKKGLYKLGTCTSFCKSDNTKTTTGQRQIPTSLRSSEKKGDTSIENLSESQGKYTTTGDHKDCSEIKFGGRPRAKEHIAPNSRAFMPIER